MDKIDDSIKLASVVKGENEVHELDKTPFAKLSGKYSQVSKIHRRSFSDRVISNNVIWEDEFGVKFMAINTKGVPVEGIEPYVEDDIYSDFSVHTYGMVDSSDVVKIEHVSKFMRSNGLPTEKIKSKSRIKNITIGGKQLDIPNFKKLLLLKSQAKQPIEVVKNYLDSVEYCEIVREMPVDERIEDLLIVNDNQGAKLKNKLMATFRYLNITEGVKLDVNNNKDVARYITETLPKKMGEYLAMFHDLELSHDYPGSKNWILIGALVDLDSVRGTPFGDAKPSDSNIEDDINQSLGALSTLFMFAPNEEPGFIRMLWSNDSETIKEISDNVKINFLDSYMKTRGVSKEFVRDHVDPDIINF